MVQILTHWLDLSWPITQDTGVPSPSKNEQKLYCNNIRKCSVEISSLYEINLYITWNRIGQMRSFQEDVTKATPHQEVHATFFLTTIALTNYGEAFREPIGNMYFAGTEAAKHWTGYMSGAIDAGERAADDIIASINGKTRSAPVPRKKVAKKSYVTPVFV